MKYTFKDVPWLAKYIPRRVAYMSLSVVARPLVAVSKTKRKKIFFLVPNYQFRSGGILSIYNLYLETKQLNKDADVFLMAGPSNNYCFRQSWFKNNFLVYNFISLKDQFKNAAGILIHIPEMFVENNIPLLNKIKSISNANIHINVLNQNNLLMPSIAIIDELKKLSDELTMTINFRSDLTVQNREKWGINLHYLPSWFINTTYEIVPYENKKNVLIVSDDHPLKSKIVAEVVKRFGVSVYNVKNVKYHDFIKVQKTAKWAISFGEGFDNIFAGAIYFGGVSFAVRSDFFPANFPVDKFENVLDNYESMLQTVVDIMLSLDNKQDYEKLNQEIYPYVYNEFNYEGHINALKLFYQKNYTL